MSDTKSRVLKTSTDDIVKDLAASLSTENVEIDEETVRAAIEDIVEKCESCDLFCRHFMFV